MVNLDRFRKDENGAIDLSSVMVGVVTIAILSMTMAFALPLLLDYAQTTQEQSDTYKTEVEEELEYAKTGVKPTPSDAPVEETVPEETEGRELW